MSKEIRIGISMRITEATNYVEDRNSIASDWSQYLMSEFPEYKWIFIPNIEEKAIDYFRQWNLNALFLTGGDDLGKYPKRDNTEFTLLKMAVEDNIPVVGICRGMQLIHVFFDGKIDQGKEEFQRTHINKKHSVTFQAEKYETNSFHSNKINEDSLHKDFKIISRCEEDLTVEAIEKPGVLGLMWHPERATPYQKWNSTYIKEFIEKYGK